MPRWLRSALEWAAVVAAFACAIALTARTVSHLFHHANAPLPGLVEALMAEGDAVDPRPEPPRRRVVVTILDGVGEPYLVDAFRSKGARIGWEARVDVGTPSLSRAGYHVLLSGTSQGASGVRTNQHVGQSPLDNLARSVRRAGGRVGFALEGYRALHDLARDDTAADLAVFGAEALTPRGFARVAGADLIFLHVVSTDEAGHRDGAASDAYRATVAKAVDDVLALRAVAPDAVWLVGADHGHARRGGHGGPEPEVVSVTWIGLFPEPVEPLDVPGRASATCLAATVAALLGVEAPHHATGEPLPLPVSAPPTTASPRRAARAALVAEAEAEASHQTRRRAFWAFVLVPALAFRKVRWASLVPLAAIVAEGVFGAGLTLSAMRDVGPFFREAGVLMSLGAAVAAVLVLRRTNGLLICACSSAPVLVLFAVHGGALTEALGPVGFFLPLVFGVAVPASFVAVVIAGIAHGARGLVRRGPR